MPDGAKFVSDKEFHEAAEKGQTDGLSLRKGFVCDTIKTFDPKKRIVDFVISTEAVDRMKDTISVNGWQLNNYKKNPVVLFSHDHRQPPIAKALSVRRNTKDKTLTSRAQFMPKDTYPFADTIFQMYVGGFMRATSVGFIPLEFERVEGDDARRGGFNFTKSELLEYSAVPIPANPEALVQAKGKGIDLGPVKEWAERVLDEWDEYEGAEVGLVIPKKDVIAIFKQSDGSTRIFRVGGADRDRLRKENIQRLRSQIMIEDKTAISYGAAHPNGTPKAPKGDKWDAGPEMMAADAKTYHIITAWFDKAGADDDGDGWPDQRQAYKLPHHRGAGNHAVVWRGVANAAARLPNTNIPAGDVKGVQAHLGRHYKEFDETAPWDSKAGAWDEYVKICQSIEQAEDFDKDLMDSYFDKLVELGFIEERASFKAESVLFPKSMWKTAATAKAWAISHKFKTDKLDETQKMYRFRQEDPNKFKQLRTICINPPGKVTSSCKVLLVGGQMKSVDTDVDDVPGDVTDLLFEFEDFNAAAWADKEPETVEDGIEEIKLGEEVDPSKDVAGEGGAGEEEDRELTNVELMDAALLVVDFLTDRIEVAGDVGIIKTRKDRRMARAIIDAMTELAENLMNGLGEQRKGATNTPETVDTDKEPRAESTSDVDIEIEDIEDNTGDDGDEFNVTDDELTDALKTVLPDLIKEEVVGRLAALTGKVE